MQYKYFYRYIHMLFTNYSSGSNFGVRRIHYIKRDIGIFVHIWKMLHVSIEHSSRRYVPSTTSAGNLLHSIYLITSLYLTASWNIHGINLSGKFSLGMTLLKLLLHLPGANDLRYISLSPIQTGHLRVHRQRFKAHGLEIEVVDQTCLYNIIMGILPHMRYLIDVPLHTISPLIAI